MDTSPVCHSMRLDAPRSRRGGAASTTSRWLMVLAATLVLALTASACGDDDSAAPDTEQAATTGEPSDDPTTTDGSEATDDPGALDDDLPPPDPDTFEGRNRVINLWVDDTGATTDIDVWASRSFTAGPSLLAEGVGFGDVTEYFSSPAGHSIVFTEAGAGPDAEDLGSMFSASESQQITAVFTMTRFAGGDLETNVPSYWEVDDANSNVPEPPADGEGLLIVRSPQVWGFEDELAEALGSASWRVGDGTGTCHPQRVEDEGFSPSILGGTQEILLDVEPGEVTVSLHEWPSTDECGADTAFTFGVDVAAGDIVVALVYTTDGETLEALVYEVDLP